VVAEQDMLHRHLLDVEEEVQEAIELLVLVQHLYKVLFYPQQKEPIIL
jgi:hypothetical protein